MPEWWSGSVLVAFWAGFFALLVTLDIRQRRRQNQLAQRAEEADRHYRRWLMETTICHRCKGSGRVYVVSTASEQRPTEREG